MNHDELNTALAMLKDIAREVRKRDSMRDKVHTLRLVDSTVGRRRSANAALDLQCEQIERLKIRFATWYDTSSLNVSPEEFVPGRFSNHLLAPNR